MGWHKSGPGKRERGRDEARRTCGGKEEGNESEANGHAIVREKYIDIPCVRALRRE